MEHLLSQAAADLTIRSEVESTLRSVLHDVEQAIALNPQHLSHYQLTLEPNTLFAAKPPAGIPEMDDAWDMQEACIARMAEAGFSQYEVSAYAREGRRCQHNLNYWTYGDYLGIGAGAHGKIVLRPAVLLARSSNRCSELVHRPDLPG